MKVESRASNNSTESRNPLASGRRLRDKTPKRTRDSSSNKVSTKKRNVTPIRTGPPLSASSKKKDMVHAKISNRALKHRRDNTDTRNRDSTPNSMRTASPITSRTPRKTRDRIPNNRKISASPLGVKPTPTTPLKVRDQPPKKAKGGRMSLFRKGGKKSKVPTDPSSPRGSDDENSLEETIKPLEVEEKSKPAVPYPKPRPAAEEVQRPKKIATKKEAKKEAKKKTQQSVSPQKNRQRADTSEDAFVVDETQCGGSSILKSADDAVLGVGYYFGKGIVAIVDGIKDSNLLQGKPPSSMVDRFSCAGGSSYDTGAPPTFEAEKKGTKSKRGYLYDDEGNRVSRDTVNK